MANVHLRQLTVCLIVLCSIVAQVNGRGGSSRGGSFSRGGSIRGSYTAGRLSISSSSSRKGGSLTTGQIVGIVCGVIGGSIAFVAIPILVKRFCLSRRTSTEEPDQTIKYSCENSVTGPPPSYTDAVSDHPENWTVTTPQPDPLKFPPPEPTVYGNPGDGRYASGNITLSYPPPPTVHIPVNN